MNLARGELMVAFVAAVLVAAISWLGLPQTLGAHPWWAARSGLYGAGLGFGLFAALRVLGLGPKWLIGAAILGLPAALAAAYFGRAAFVSAEDFNATAGRIWYLGWIGLATSICMLLPGLYSHLRKPA